MAAYGAQISQGKSPAQAQAYLSKLLQERGGAARERQRGAADVPLGSG